MELSGAQIGKDSTVIPPTRSLNFFPFRLKRKEVHVLLGAIEKATGQMMGGPFPSTSL